ncbi:hypothetical protein CI109_100447 [Kwoniella shandongensis]|uniref:GPI mannosyltransferase 1 n=1 Tax=Kwoniella shandongensis TaxID=1734106 RepID=A0A5M6C4P2_9TREE|nr:uncharacterized protein CI109_001710 [Kwoniella shandongensis]KAA5529771.1 hypothetical protein CI109_001710 [Kwoniella shandongensis]
MAESSLGQTRKRRTRTSHLLIPSFFIHLLLLIYAEHVDSHPERYGGLRYTDVDWRVVSDGARLIFHPQKGQEAKGWLVNRLGWNIGDPYERATFRYTPLLPLFLSPTLLHPLLGKLLLALTSLSIPPLLLTPSSPATFWPTHLLWTLNPFVLNITTRGSPEAIICLLVVLVIYSLQRKRDTWAGVALGLAVSWKLYPFIYVASVWTYLAKRRRYGWLGKEVWKFGFVTAGTVVVVNGLLWSIWGQTFLEHTYLYHLHRLDHRHNFSPYFYPIYLSFFPSPSSPLEQSSSSSTSALLTTILRHPLTSFLPQNTLVLLAGFVLTPVTGLEFAMFVQTTTFVIFNKVVTSQYFTWFLPLIPYIIPSLSFTRRKTAILISAWVAGQAIWLGTAYRLELMAQDVYLSVWMAGLVLFGISVWVIGEIIEGWVGGGTGKEIIKTD